MIYKVGDEIVEVKVIRYKADQPDIREDVEKYANHFLLRRAVQPIIFLISGRALDETEEN